MQEVSIKRKELYILVLLGLIFIILLKLLVGNQLLAVILSLIVILPSIVFVSTLRWKWLFYFFFLWLLLEGIFRKWILPEYSKPIFFVKHLLLIGPYFYMFSKGVKISKRDYPFFGLLLAYILWGLFEAFNFRATTDFRVQILGLINHFWFIPLIVLVPLVLDGEEKISKFFRMTAYISLPIFVLGIMQYYAPPTSPLNTYAPSAVDMHIAAVGSYVRITSVFSYITPYTNYLGLSLMIILYLLVMGRSGKYETLVLISAISLGMVNLIMTGSRSPVIGFLIQALPFLYICLSLKGKLKIKKKFLLRFMLVMPVLLFTFMYTDTGSRAFSAFIDRTKTVSADIVPRLKDNFTPFKFLPEAGLIGYGIGTAYQGAANLVDDWGDMPRQFEEESERIVLELGLVGFIIVTLLRAYIFFYSWLVFKRMKSYELKLIAFIIFIGQGAVLLGANIVFNYMQSILYWFLIGLLVAVSRLDRNNATKNFSISPR